MAGVRTSIRSDSKRFGSHRKYRRCRRARQRYPTSGWLDQERVKTTNDGGGTGQAFRPVKSPGERREHSSNLFVALRSIQAAIVPRSDDSRRSLSPSLLSLAPLSSPGSSLYHFPRLCQPTAPLQRLPRSKYVGGWMRLDIQPWLILLVSFSPRRSILPNGTPGAFSQMRTRYPSARDRERFSTCLVAATCLSRHATNRSSALLESSVWSTATSSFRFVQPRARVRPNRQIGSGTRASAAEVHLSELHLLQRNFSQCSINRTFAIT